MNTYHFKRSSRSAANWVFALLGLFLLSAGAAGSHYKWNHADAGEFIMFALATGLLSFFSGVAGLLIKTEWGLDIDEKRLIWKSGAKGGDVHTNEIKKVSITEGDFRSVVVEMKDSIKYTIPGECFGNGRALSKWFRENLSDINQDFHE